MELTPTVAAILGALVGAATTGLLTILGQWLARRSDERRHLLDLCFKTAITNWERDTKMAEAQASATGQRVAISPFDLYFIHMLGLTKLVNLPQEQILVEWEHIRNRTRAAFEATRQKQPS